MSELNRQFLLNARPVGEVKLSDLRFHKTEIPELGQGEFLVQVRYLGLEPAMRGWMEEIGKPKSGDTVVVSGAAGATGSIAGQIARIAGALVIGIAGCEKKCSWLKQHFLDGDLHHREDILEGFERILEALLRLFHGDNIGKQLVRV